MQLKIVLAVLAIVSLAALTAGAKELEQKELLWKRFGVIKMEITKASNSNVIKAAHYANGERIDESEIDGKKIQHIYVQPSRVDLYTSEFKEIKEEKEISLGSRLLIDFVIICLRRAYPEGPETVPPTAKVTTVVIDAKNTKINITTTRISEHDISFVIVPNDPEEATLSGVWGDRLLNPLPNDFSVAGSHHEFPDQVKTLQEARSLKLPPTQNNK